MEKVQQVKILLADDHKIIRDGVRAVLAGENRFEIVGEAETGKELLTLMENTPTDVVILDIHMPGPRATDLCESILVKYPHTKVLVLTMFNSSVQLQRMREAGASGYLLKEAGADEMKRAIQDVSSGKTYFPAEPKGKAAGSGQAANAVDNSNLTRREMEILRLISTEFTTREIADKLFISQRTVDTHRRNLMKKLGVKNTAGLVRYAVLEGLID